MDNTREKLIDVFMHIGDHIRSLDEYGFGFDSTLAEAIEDVVAMLKNQDANGVTVQKWIPVTERLPETDCEVVLVCGIRKGIYTAEFRRNGNYTWFHKLNSKCHHCEPTHWMPLPEPPSDP